MHTKPYTAVGVRHLSLNSTTLAHNIYLGLVTAGYYPGATIAQFRYWKRGGFRCWEDTLFAYKNANPDIVQRLKEVSLPYSSIQSVSLLQGHIFDMPPSVKLDLLLCVCNHMLSFLRFRDRADQQADTIRQARRDLTQARAWEMQQERESAAVK